MSAPLVRERRFETYRIFGTQADGAFASCAPQVVECEDCILVFRDLDAMKEEAELLRLQYKYRSLIVRGQLRLPLEAAKRLIGPDCAYHLYASFGNEGEGEGSRRGGTGADSGR